MPAACPNTRSASSRAGLSRRYLSPRSAPLRGRFCELTGGGSDEAAFPASAPVPPRMPAPRRALGGCASGGTQEYLEVLVKQLLSNFAVESPRSRLWLYALRLVAGVLTPAGMPRGIRRRFR